jgi:hypothetical protein
MVTSIFTQSNVVILNIQYPAGQLTQNYVASGQVNPNTWLQ